MIYLLLIACISIQAPQPSSREEQIRLELKELHRHSQELYELVHHLEADVDIFRSDTQKDKAAFIVEAKEKLQKIEEKEQKLQAEFKDWKKQLRLETLPE